MEWLNYHHLQYFWMVAKHGSITRASKELRLAHPTISGQIHRLEQVLGEKLFARSKDQYDGAQPSGNSMAVRNLVRLWAATGEERYRAEAEKDFKAFAGTLRGKTAVTNGSSPALSR